MNETTVINIKHCPDFNPQKNPNDVYIGKSHQSAKHGIFRWSKWHNPYKIGKHIFGTYVTREESIAMYREYIIHNSVLLASLYELKGKRLGCWCKPEACHGDVLIELLKEKTNETNKV